MPRKFSALERYAQRGIVYLKQIDSGKFAPSKSRRRATHHLLVQDAPMFRSEPPSIKIAPIEFPKRPKSAACWLLVDPAGNIRDVYTSKPGSVIAWPYVNDNFNRGHVCDPQDTLAARRMGYRVVPAKILAP